MCVNNKVHLFVLIESFTSESHLDSTRVCLNFDKAKDLLDGKMLFFWLDFLQCFFIEMANQLVNCSMVLPTTL